MPKTFSELLRQFSAPELHEALARHGCAATKILIRRWWADEMLPPRAWRAFVAACAERGIKVTLEDLARIAETPREDRQALNEARSAEQTAA